MEGWFSVSQNRHRKTVELKIKVKVKVKIELKGRVGLISITEAGLTVVVT